MPTMESPGTVVPVLNLQQQEVVVEDTWPTIILKKGLC